MLRKENDSFKQENRMLRDKIGQLSDDLDQADKQRGNMDQMNQLIDENRRLRNGSNDRDHEEKRQNEQLRSLLQQKDNSINK